MQGGAGAAAGASSSITIYDIKNKFSAFTLKMESISLLVSEFSSLFVVTADHKLFQLTEHDLNSKMEKLFKMNLYQISISLASNSSMDRSYVMDIFQRYGDHLYSKGDYDGAIQQVSLHVSSAAWVIFHVRLLERHRRISRRASFFPVSHSTWRRSNTWSRRM